MLHTLLTFAPLAALPTITPGATTALVVSSAVKFAGAAVLIVMGARSLCRRPESDAPAPWRWGL